MNELCRTIRSSDSLCIDCECLLIEGGFVCKSSARPVKNSPSELFESQERFPLARCAGMLELQCPESSSENSERVTAV